MEYHPFNEIRHQRIIISRSTSPCLGLGNNSSKVVFVVCQFRPWRIARGGVDIILFFCQKIEIYQINKIYCNIFFPLKLNISLYAKKRNLLKINKIY